MTRVQELLVTFNAVLNRVLDEIFGGEKCGFSKVFGTFREIILYNVSRGYNPAGVCLKPCIRPQTGPDPKILK